MQNDYENQIQSLRSDCEDLENETEQLKIDINNLRSKCQREVQEILYEMNPPTSSCSVVFHFCAYS